MKKLIIVVGIVIAIVGGLFIGMRIYTKSFSPADVATYSQEGMDISVRYSRPYKKNRVIFGGLVPYDKVWRTGANEPTVFTTETDLVIGEKTLLKGSYALFTKPGEDSWEIIFNQPIPSRGVKIPSGEAARDEAADALVIEVSAINTQNVFDQFTIDFESMHNEIDMVMMWDQTMVVIPITLQ